MDELLMKIEEWASARGLATADPNKQMLKLGEEYGELCAGMARSNMETVVDSIGDMFVVMTILCQQLNLDFEDCVQRAYDEIKGRKGRMIDGVFVKEADIKGFGNGKFEVIDSTTGEVIMEGKSAPVEDDSFLGIEPKCSVCLGGNTDYVCKGCRMEMDQ